MRAATSLLTRAADLYPADDARRLPILIGLGRANHEAGQWDRAEAALSEAVRIGETVGDRPLTADASVALTHLRLFSDTSATHARIRSELAEPVLVFEEYGDEGGLGRALGLAGQLRFWAGDSIAAIDDLERSAQYARNAGDRFQESISLTYVLIASLHGPTPVAVALERAQQLRGRVDGDRRLEATTLRCQARLEGMRGNFDVARGLAEEGLALAEELGLGVAAAGLRSELGELELGAGRVAVAEALVRTACESLERMGNRGHWVTVAAGLGDALLAQDRLDDAAAVIERIEDWAIDDDLDPQVGWRRLKGRLLAHRSEFEEAERIAREAVELAGRADYIDIQARTHFDLAEVLRLAGRTEDVSIELEHALRLYEQKGNVVGAERARSLL
jgi:tetratricopeptide (TPR) repeat protein